MSEILTVMRTGHSNEIPGMHEYYLEVTSGPKTGQKIVIVTGQPIDIKPLQRFDIIFK